MSIDLRYSNATKKWKKYHCPLCFALNSLVISFTQFMSPCYAPLSLKECVDMTDKGGGELRKPRRRA